MNSLQITIRIALAPLPACAPAAIAADRDDGAHGMWKWKDVPKAGWRWLYAEDGGEICENCEMCLTGIRYRHFLVHDRYPRPVMSGVCCAGHMTNETEAGRARSAEKALRGTVRRRATWLARKWISSYGDHSYLRAGVWSVLVYTGAFGSWGFRIHRRDLSEAPVFQPHWYPSEDAAKLAAFDALQTISRQ